MAPGLSAAEALAEVRRICAPMPGVTERPSHGTPTWFAGRRSFVMFWDDHHGDGRVAIWCAAPEGAQAESTRSEPARFFVPPYVGHRGWLGVRLDVDPDPTELAGILIDAYLCVATARLAAELRGS